MLFPSSSPRRPPLSTCTGMLRMRCMRREKCCSRRSPGHGIDRPGNLAPPPRLWIHSAHTWDSDNDAPSWQSSLAAGFHFFILARPIDRDRSKNSSAGRARVTRRGSNEKAAPRLRGRARRDDGERGTARHGQPYRGEKEGAHRHRPGRGQASDGGVGDHRGEAR